MYVDEREDRRGRPTSMPSKKRGLNYSVYLDEEQLNVLDEIRWRERKSTSALVRKAIEEYINNHAEGNDCFTLDKWQEDPHFKNYILFYEYFHGDSGRGVGASHQTGWTGLIAKLLQPRHAEIPTTKPEFKVTTEGVLKEVL